MNKTSWRRGEGALFILLLMREVASRARGFFVPLPLALHTEYQVRHLDAAIVLG